MVYEKTWSLPTWTVQAEKTYLYAQGKMAVTKETVNGQTTLCYYATDHLGTVRAVVGVDTSGVEKSRSLHDYEPYGLEIVPLQVSTHTHRFTVHERDVLDALSNTTLDYMHFRSYASATARFLKPDNVWGSVMNPQSWNLYAYCANNPVGRNDPTGHLSELFMREIHASPSDQGIGATRTADGTPSGDKNGEKQAEDVRAKAIGSNAPDEKQPVYSDLAPEGVSTDAKVEAAISVTATATDIAKHVEGTATEAGPALGKVVTGLSAVTEVAAFGKNVLEIRANGSGMSKKELKETLLHMGTSGTTCVVSAFLGPETGGVTWYATVLSGAAFGSDVGKLINAYVEPSRVVEKAKADGGAFYQGMLQSLHVPY